MTSDPPNGERLPPVDEPSADLRNDDLQNDDLQNDDLQNDAPRNFDRLIPRVLRNMAVFSMALVVPAFWFYGRPGALGFALGAVISYLNFRSLKRSVEGLTDRIANQNSRERGGLIVLRFLLRYGLVGAAAYAIFMSSPAAFRAFLWGMCVPVAALMIEAGWQGFSALRPRKLRATGHDL